MPESAGFYRRMGFAPKLAEYYASGRKTIVDAVPNKDFTLTLTFDNGEKRIYNMKPLLCKGTVYEPLLSWKQFQKVYVDENHCPAWNVLADSNSEFGWNHKLIAEPDSCYVDSVPAEENK